jgi:hypothetical protein
MRTTYSHLRDSDYINEARDAFGKEVQEQPDELTPTVCPKCGETPPESAKLCPWCGLEFTPDAKETIEEADDDVKESYKEADDMGEVDAVTELDEMLEDVKEDPELKAALIEKLQED